MSASRKYFLCAVSPLEKVDCRLMRMMAKSSDSLHIVQASSWPCLTLSCVKTRFCLFGF